jgi:CRP-like cAMP-binding protein
MPLKVIPRRDRKLYRLIKASETQTLRRGQALYSTGDEPGFLFLVRQGHLRQVTKATKARGEERTVGLVGPWEVGGGEALVPWARRRTAARAGEKAQVTLLDGRAVNRILKSSAKTLEQYLLAVEEEMELNRTLGRLTKPGGAPGRLAAILLDLSNRLGQQGDKEGDLWIPQSLTHGVLADLSQCHRSTVTTLLNEWIYDGILGEPERGILVRKTSKLRKIVRAD